MSSVFQSKNDYRQNYKGFKGYQSALDAGRMPFAKDITLPRDDRIRRHIINHLMCSLELEFKVLDQELGIDSEGDLAKELARLQTLVEDGIVILH